MKRDDSHGLVMGDLVIIETAQSYGDEPGFCAVS